MEITYHPEVISLRGMIDLYWTTYDLTNGRGVAPDFGAQYRSIPFYASETEKTAIITSTAAYQSFGKISKPIATQIVQFRTL